jgi:hypothetical protein
MIFHRTERFFRGALMLALLLLILGGCVANYGRLKLDPELARTFAQGEALPGYVYYYAGRMGMPNVIIGVKEGFTFTSRFWRTVDVKAGELRTLSQRMFPYANETERAYYVMAPDGTSAVIWYSLYPAEGPVVKFGEGNTVQVFQPSYDDGFSVF